MQPGEVRSKLVGRRVRGWLAPTLSDVLLLGLVVWLLVITVSDPKGGLLMDAAAGTHVRTGEHIVTTGELIYRDPFSFSKPNAEWFAWEWLADVAFYGIHAAFGLRGLAVFAAGLAVLTIGIVLRQMCAWGSNTLATLFVIHAVIAATSVHFLARPHMLTMVFLAACFSLIHADRVRPTRWLYGTVPLTAIWANAHGGFAGLIVSFGVLAAGSVLEGNWGRVRRYAVLGVACLGASLANPYGYHLHVHMAKYLNAGWIREIVEEFQPQPLDTAPGVYFVLLLVSGAVVVVKLAREREFGQGLLILAWAYAAWGSARHIPIYAILVGPYLARELSALLNRMAAAGGAKSVAGILRQVGAEYQPAIARTSLAVPVLLIVLLGAGQSLFAIADFTPQRFPLEAIRTHAAAIRSARVFTLDNWGDYLIYRNYPQQRVFFDGRTDYYGPEITRDYITLIQARDGWERLLDHYRFNAVLLAESSPLIAKLRGHAGWHQGQAVSGTAFFERQ